jgi:predicted transcriptional regulator
MGFEKKLLGYAIEKQSQHMIDLSPKMYTAFNDNSTVSLKLKGVSIKQNNLNNYHYLRMLEEKCSIKSEQRNLRTYRNVITKINLNKTSLSAFHNKYVELDDFSTCGPFL